MPWVTLSPAGGGGALEEGSPDHRYAFRLDLDAEGRAVPEAWRGGADGPWPARRWWPGEGSPLHGDVQHDEDYGWALRFFRRADAASDAPLQVAFDAGARFRPGEVLSVTEPDGTSNAWRVVSVAEAEGAWEDAALVEPRGVEPLTS